MGKTSKGKDYMLDFSRSMKQISGLVVLSGGKGRVYLNGQHQFVVLNTSAWGEISKEGVKRERDKFIRSREAASWASLMELPDVIEAW